MKQLVTLATLLLLAPVQAQTVLFSEDFESAQPAFQLNTADVSSATSSAENTWVINNAYNGGSGSIVCFGFPLPFTIPNTAGQPAGITNAGGSYMHIVSQAALNSGISNCCFVAADGLCANAANHFSRMTTDITTGPNAVTLSFWWLCGGGNNNYGEVYYSVNGGSSWTLVSSPIAQYRNQSSWVQQNISLPEFSNRPTLRFGFRFVNNVTANAQDPGFGLDDITIVEDGAVVNGITCSVPAPLTFCQGTSLVVPFTATGSYAPGNVFTAELSDATGGFLAPVAIGSLASQSSGSIACVIPPATMVGTGYRIRVVASDPATDGAPNTADITVEAAPYAGPDAQVTLCKNTGTYALLDLLGGSPSPCGAWTDASGSPFSGMFDTDADNAGVYTYTTNCPGSCPQDMATLTIALENPANAGNDVNVQLCSNAPPTDPISFVAGGTLDGLFFYQGQTTPLPDFSVAGVYELDYVVYGQGPCENDTASMVITVVAGPEAGTNNTVTVCANAAPFQLFSFLGGSPDLNGTWTGPTGQPSSGTFNPSTSQPGLYTYQVPGIPPCQDDQAFVAVVVDPCLGIAEMPSESAPRWLGQQGGVHFFQLDRSGPVHTEVRDATGRVVPASAGYDQGRALVEMNGTTGLYFIRFERAGEAVSVRFLHRTE
ncbi:MAG: hypothetical protein R2815_02905 [Flavobacteriales bacterium]